MPQGWGFIPTLFKLIKITKERKRKEKMEQLNKKELVRLVAEELDVQKKEITMVVDTVFETIAKKLVEGTTVSITNFGKFEVRDTAPRAGVNPQTGEPLAIPASKKVAFKASSVLKNAVKA